MTEYGAVVLEPGKYKNILSSMVRNIPRASMLDYGGKTVTVVAPKEKLYRVINFGRKNEINVD